MPNDQAQADTTEETTATDPLDAVDSTTSGTNEIAAYEAELAAALSAVDVTDTQGDEPVDGAATDDEPATETVADETLSDGDAEAATDDEPEAKAKDRFRFKNSDDQAVAAIAKAKGISLVEAARIFAGESIPAKPQEQAAEEAPGDTIDSVTARIEELEELDAQASEALEFSTAAEHRREANKLRNQLMDLKIADVQAKARAEQSQSEAFYDAYAQSESKTLRFYPDAAKADSALTKEMIRLEAEMRELGDPLFNSPDKPFILAKQAAMNTGTLMTKSGAVPVSKANSVRPTIQPAGGNARTTATAPAARQEEAIDKIDSIVDYEKFVAGLR